MINTSLFEINFFFEVLRPQSCVIQKLGTVPNFLHFGMFRAETCIVERGSFLQNEDIIHILKSMEGRTSGEL